MNFFGSCIINDLSSRYNINDPYLSSYFLLWTSSYFVPVLLILLTLSAFYFRLTLYVSKPLIHFFSYQIVGLIILKQLLDIIILNYNSFLFTNSVNLINQLLTNGLNQYHPYIFYVSIVIVSVNIIWVRIIQYSHIQHSIFSYNAVITKTQLLKILFYESIFLYLGAWWAIQEGTWGGWWNSDISEMIGLWLLIVTLSTLHLKPSLDLYFKNLTLFYLVCIVFIILYNNLQIHYDSISHNFSFKFFAFSNKNFYLRFIVYLSIVLLISKYLKIKLYIFYHVYICIIKTRKRLKWIVLNICLLATLCIMWYYMSVVFFSNFENILNSNTHISIIEEMYFFIQTVVFFYIIFLFFKINEINLLNIAACLALNTTYLTYFIIQTEQVNRLISTIHWLFLLFLSINLQTNNLLVVYFDTQSYFSAITSGSGIYFNHLSVHICDNLTYTKQLLLSNSYFQLFYTYNFRTNNNFFNYDSFLLLFNNNLTMNWSYFINSYETYFALIELNDVSNLNLIFILISLSSFYYLKFNQTQLY